VKIVVNGREMEVAPGSSLLDLIAELGLDRRYLVVECNGEPVARDRFQALRLDESDRLELVRPVAGG
jgi:thiamine biosynthesis protein ThiS